MRSRLRASDAHPPGAVISPSALRLPVVASRCPGQMTSEPAPTSLHPGRPSVTSGWRPRKKSVGAPRQPGVEAPHRTVVLERSAGISKRASASSSDCGAMSRRSTHVRLQPLNKQKWELRQRSCCAAFVIINAEDQLGDRDDVVSGPNTTPADGSESAACRRAACMLNGISRG